MRAKNKVPNLAVPGNGATRLLLHVLSLSLAVPEKHRSVK